MNAIDELIHYCKDDDPLGALLFTGEWGSGKTHVIENDLKEALGEDYAIVRVSLYGVNTAAALHDAARRQYISVCYPFANRIQEKKEKADKSSGFMQFLRTLVGIKYPILGSAADLVSSMNALDLITIKPEFEDFKTLKKRKVILVFDDLERCEISMVQLLGVVNDYCENQRFNTIVVANLQYLIVTIKDTTRLNMLKGKTVCQTVVYQPDYETIIHHIINKRSWRSEEYKNFLLENEEKICEVFSSPVTADEESCQKPHNLLTLIIALRDFYRLYYHINRTGAGISQDLLLSYIPYMLCKNNPVFKGKTPVFGLSDEDIKALYPQYRKDIVFSSVRQWADSGYFDEETFLKQLGQYNGK